MLPYHINPHHSLHLNQKNMSDNLFSYYPPPTPPEGRRGDYSYLRIRQYPLHYSSPPPFGRRDDYSYLLKDNIHFTNQALLPSGGAGGGY